MQLSGKPFIFDDWHSPCDILDEAVEQAEEAELDTHGRVPEIMNENLSEHVESASVSILTIKI